MIIEILYIVFWVLGMVFYPWRGSPWQGWVWTPHIFYMLMFALAGIALFERSGLTLLR